MSYHDVLVIFDIDMWIEIHDLHLVPFRAPTPEEKPMFIEPGHLSNKRVTHGILQQLLAGKVFEINPAVVVGMHTVIDSLHDHRVAGLSQHLILTHQLINLQTQILDEFLIR